MQGYCDAHLAQPQKPLYREFVNRAWRLFPMQAAGMTARWQQAFRGHGFENADRAVLSLKNGAAWLTTGRPYQEIPVWPKGENLPHEVETAV